MAAESRAGAGGGGKRVGRLSPSEAGTVAGSSLHPHRRSVDAGQAVGQGIFVCEFWGLSGGTLPMGHQRRQLVHEVREHEPGPLVKVGTHTVKHGNAESIAVLIGVHCSSGGADAGERDPE